MKQHKWCNTTLNVSEPCGFVRLLFGSIIGTDVFRLLQDFPLAFKRAVGSNQSAIAILFAVLPYFSLALCIPAVIHSHWNGCGQTPICSGPQRPTLAAAGRGPGSIPPRKTVIMELDCRVCDDDKKPTPCAKPFHRTRKKENCEEKLMALQILAAFLYWPPYGAVCYNWWHMVLNSDWNIWTITQRIELITHAN